ncbi:4-hydroxythreonine-4-phosphate dehydrogenase PdxA [Sporosarcina aquimarina]|uniref:4-hydroxythreonine-4-phosphate dehydrogenase PdxA n=1 Tax=Sporosarcina aquimarina TaxID=114975 RepID=A0ABU4G2F5_9BACL|nr:4-hydroxythreonine-4-phosphate dehydrogenase PdxA [Sporosarcina aquimarina]MDW0111149.1 4-hydroxythreonine-4-phosphate dehydrogenase PdxA [Sporosarcina aquimarina]
MKNDNLLIAVTLGDASGIGPELIVKAFQHEAIKSSAAWLIVGDKRVFEQGQEIAGLTLPVTDVSDLAQVSKNKGDVYFFDLKNLAPEEYKLGEVSIQSGRVTGETLKLVLELSKSNLIDGVIYAPLNKEALHRGGHHFQDELHFFADLLNCESGFSEINVMEKLWVTRVTSHIPLKNVSENISREKVYERIMFADKTLKSANFENPKIAVAALNPHAGEGGMLGNEEIDHIRPAIEQAKREGVNIEGPYPADTLFLRLGKDPFDCLLAMYHDQAQTGMKMLGFNKGVTMSGGLPITLTTPAHGTAFDIAGKGKADEGATVEAMKMVVKMNS